MFTFELKYFAREEETIQLADGGSCIRSKPAHYKARAIELKEPDTCWAYGEEPADALRNAKEHAYYCAARVYIKGSDAAY